MITIKSSEEMALEFVKKTVYKPKFYSLKYNDKVIYNCGCKNDHRLNDESILVFSMARPGVNFIFLCTKKFYSLVSVKGFFSTKATTVWTCKQKVFNDYLKKIGMYESLIANDPRFK